MKNQTPEIILASASKSRKVLLKNAGLKFRVETSNVDEKKLKEKFQGTPVEDLVLKLAGAKAEAVYQSNKKSLIIGADQMLECENTLYDKPIDYSNAFEHLKNLQGKMHRLVTGVSIVYHGEIIWSFVDQVNLEMRSLSDKFISEYLEIVGPEIFSTVGSYRLEGHGVQLFNQVKGDFFTVLGLPVLPLLTFLRLKNFMVS
tara:strand:- start:1198 stop:1800 length:603 start_codon:yes stop_codon:yes gene_type:complete